MEKETHKLFESEIAGAAVVYSVAECRVTTDTGVHRRFGVSVERAGGEIAEYTDIFPTPEEARDFLATLRRCEVTPVTLGDIVYDHLCREDIHV